jgi:hypothetical protein
MILCWWNDAHRWTWCYRNFCWLVKWPDSSRGHFLYILFFVFWRNRKLIWNCVTRFDNVKWDSDIRCHCDLWGGVVSTVIMVLSGRSGVGTRLETSYFYLLQIVHNGCETILLSVQNVWMLFCGVKPSWLEVYHLDSSSAEVMDEWSHTSTPSVCLHGVDRDTFTFFLPFYRKSIIDKK